MKTKPPSQLGAQANTSRSKAVNEIDPRKESVRILTALSPDFHYSDRHLSQELEKYIFNQETKNRIVFLVKGTIQWRSSLDLELQKHIKRKLEKLPYPLINTLRAAVFQLRHADTIPDQIVVNESVNLIKKTAPAFTGLANAVLRRIAAADDLENQKSSDIPKSSYENLSDDEFAARLAHPGWLIRKFVKRYGRDETIDLAAYNNQRWPVSIWINTLKTNKTELAHILKSEGIECADSRYISNSLVIANSRNLNFKKLETFTQGLFHPIDESSALIPLLVNPVPGENILDLCSAPGGKTAIMSQLMKGKGQIIATDASPKRIKLVESNINRLGLENIITFPADGTAKGFETVFDKILVDAPCSGTGVLGRKVDLKWNRKESDIPDLVRLQQALLENAKNFIKIGGSIIYSTCSLEEEENDQVVDLFLRHNRNFRLEMFEINKDFILDTCAVLFERSFFKTLPHKHRLGGMFAARLLRLE